MSILASAFMEPTGQGWAEVADLLVAFALSSVVGMEREMRGKSAGLRTQTIVGTAAGLIVLVSKYGFSDVLAGGRVVLDPSRVTAQIISGIGFLGAGLIITRGGAIRGLTTAASVWETAAIGMAAGAGLPVLAAVVTVLHFVVVLGFTKVTGVLPHGKRGTVHLRVVYEDRHGVLRELLSRCTSRGWSVVGLSVDRMAETGIGHLLAEEQSTGRQVVVSLALAGEGVSAAPAVLADTEGVYHIDRMEDVTE